MATPQFDAIPAALRILPHWLLWKYEPGKNGKPTKVPKTIYGDNASSTVKATWSHFDKVRQVFESGGYDGIGFVFTRESGFSGVDLDHCRDPGTGQIDEWAVAIIARLNSYTEISPSGAGVHIIMRGLLPAGVDGCKKELSGPGYRPEAGIEMYSSKRYLTFTGERLQSTPEEPENRPEEIIEVYTKFFGPIEPRPEVSPQPKPVVVGDVPAKLQTIFEADPKLKADFMTPAEVGERSTREFDLCARLYKHGLNEAEIEAAMNLSPQEKWKERNNDNYRPATVERAVAAAKAGGVNLKDLPDRLKENPRAIKEAIPALARLKAADPVEFDLVIKQIRDAKVGITTDTIKKAIIKYETPTRTTKSDPNKPQAENNGDIRFEEIVEVEKFGQIEKKTLRPSWATKAILSRMPLAMDADSEDIYYFDGQIYLPDGARKIDIELCKAANDLVTADKLKETLRRIRNALKEKPVTFDPNPYLLGVKNGVANLLTGEVREYRPEDLMTDQIPVEYDPAARCPAFLAFLESITPNPSDRITLIDWFVAHAIKEPLPYVLFLLGLGRNGKGIYEKLLKAFFGRAAFRDMPLSEINRNNFAASGFYRKRGWIASETGKKKATIGTDFMKLTSGNGVIDGDRKNQSRIQFEPYFQTTVDTNNMPQVEDNSIGWMERFIKIDLPYMFVANPGASNPLEKLRDPHIFEKLSTPAELSGILNLILYRSPEICKTKTIHKRPAAEMFTEYADQSSSVKAFLDEFCEYDSSLFGLRTPSEPIYEAYCEWCKYKVGEVVNKVYFGRQLKRFCGGIEPRRGTNKDTQKRTTDYQGLLFDSSKYQSVLKALRLSFVREQTGNVQVKYKKEEEKEDLQITNVQVIQVNVWIDFIARFGGDPENKGNEGLAENSSKQECENLLGLPGLLVQPTSGGTVSEEATCTLLVQSHNLPVTEPAAPVKKEFDPSVDVVDVDNHAAEDATAQDIARDQHFKKKALSVAGKSAPPDDKAAIRNDPGFQAFKERMSRRKCILCGRSFPYDLTRYDNRDVHGYICATCHMQGPPPKLEATRQEKLPVRGEIA